MADYVARASLALCGGNDITNGRDGAAMLIWPFWLSLTSLGGIETSEQ